MIERGTQEALRGARTIFCFLTWVGVVWMFHLEQFVMLYICIACTFLNLFIIFQPLPKRGFKNMSTSDVYPHVPVGFPADSAAFEELISPVSGPAQDPVDSLGGKQSLKPEGNCPGALDCAGRQERRPGAWGPHLT